jgi:hypothetical protein
VLPGEIWKLDRFYLDTSSGELLPKYVLVLAVGRAGDLVGRLLTSRSHGRPEQPRCFHGDPYPGYYLGVLGGPLPAKSWLDLRKFEDLDGFDVARKKRQGTATQTVVIARELLIDVLDCVARAEDTTVQQSRAILDVLDRLRSGA